MRQINYIHTIEMSKNSTVDMAVTGLAYLLIFGAFGAASYFTYKGVTSGYQTYNPEMEEGFGNKTVSTVLMALSIVVAAIVFILMLMSGLKLSSYDVGTSGIVILVVAIIVAIISGSVPF